MSFPVVDRPASYRGPSWRAVRQDEERIVYHEHFAFRADIAVHPDVLGRPREYVEVFFDTRSRDLMEKNIWLRCREFIDAKEVEWALKVEVRASSCCVLSLPLPAGTPNVP